MILRNCISEASDFILVWFRGFASGWSPAKGINSKNNVKMIVFFVGAKAHWEQTLHEKSFISSACFIVSGQYCRTVKQGQDRDLIVYSSHFILMFQALHPY